MALDFRVPGFLALRLPVLLKFPALVILVCYRLARQKPAVDWQPPQLIQDQDYCLPEQRAGRA